MNIEHGTFTPLTFSIHGGMGPECAAYHQNLTEKIAPNTGEQYAKFLTFTRCKFSFIVLRSVLLCLTGSRTIASRNLVAIYDNFVLNQFSKILIFMLQVLELLTFYVSIILNRLNVFYLFKCL